jgi:hypothetical protein
MGRDTANETRFVKCKLKALTPQRSAAGRLRRATASSEAGSSLATIAKKITKKPGKAEPKKYFS